MATIKSYTDLEQSKKLAEILPLESADMSYYIWKDDGHLMSPIPFVLDGTEVKDGMFEYIPCWSLSALLDVVSEVSLNSFKDGNWNAMVTRNNKMIYADKDNPVDACYEMILKLHELNLL